VSLFFSPSTRKRAGGIRPTPSCAERPFSPFPSFPFFGVCLQALWEGVLFFFFMSTFPPLPFSPGKGRLEGVFLLDVPFLAARIFPAGAGGGQFS